MSKERIALACPLQRQHLASCADLLSAGVGKRAVSAAVRSGELLRVHRGVYTSVPLPERARHLVSGGRPDAGYLAEVRAILLAMGPSAVAGGRTAAVLWGFDLLVEPTSVEVVTRSARGHEPPEGAKVTRKRDLAATDLLVLGGQALRVLTPVETVVHCALTRPLREAVVIADSALRGGLELAELHTALTAARPSALRLRRVLALVDPDSGSVLESVLRVLLAQHGLVPESQVNLYDAQGRLIGRVDFLFRDQRLVVECDGRRWHDPDDARERDRLRDNELERAAWRLVRLTWSDVVHRPERALALVRDCLTPWPVAA